MSESQRDYLRTKAHFIAGMPARFRDPADTQANSAVHDAERFLASLPPHLKPPVISAGTTNDPTTFLSFTWMIAGYPTIKTIAISFKGNDAYQASWDEPSGARNERAVTGFQNLAALDVPQKINNLAAGSTSPRSRQQQQLHPQKPGPT